MVRLPVTLGSTLALLALLLPATAQAAELDLPQKASGTSFVDKGFNGIESAYDTLIRLASIGVGAPNATTRNTDQNFTQPTKLQKVRLVPNTADHVANAMLNWSALRAGGNSLNATSKNALPRYTMETSYDAKKQ